MSNLRKRIMAGQLFPISELNMKTISSTASLFKEQAQKEAVKIAEEKKHVAVTFQYSDLRKTNCLLQIIDRSHFGMESTHPQFVNDIPNTPFCVIKSDRAA